MEVRIFRAREVALKIYAAPISQALVMLFTISGEAMTGVSKFIDSLTAGAEMSSCTLEVLTGKGGDKVTRTRELSSPARAKS